MFLNSPYSYQQGSRAPFLCSYSAEERRSDYSQPCPSAEHSTQSIYSTAAVYNAEFNNEVIRKYYEDDTILSPKYYWARRENKSIVPSYVPYINQREQSRNPNHKYKLCKERNCNVFDKDDNKLYKQNVGYNPFQRYIASAVSKYVRHKFVPSQKSSLFLGKDSSYPADLNKLMNPFFCELCHSRLNSIKSANIHYESKVHDRHITAWLKKKYADKGLLVPKLKRFFRETSMDISASSAYYCYLCKLDLSSSQHALQHFNGKRHRHAASNLSSISGIGYFNLEGNWVETGKVFDIDTGSETPYILVNTPTGFEPVVLHDARNSPSSHKRAVHLITQNPDHTSSFELLDNIVQSEEEISNNTINRMHSPPKKTCYSNCVPQKSTYYKKVSSDIVQKSTLHLKVIKEKISPSTMTGIVSTNNLNKTLPLESHQPLRAQQTVRKALDTNECKFCKISTKSRNQMLQHLKGTRHSKQLKALGESPILSISQTSSSTILESLCEHDPLDVSIYRTPSGSYYCKFCNIAINDSHAIKRHTASKKHLINSKNFIKDEYILSSRIK